MNKKLLLPIVIVVILVGGIGIYFATRAAKRPGERPAVTVPEEREERGDIPLDCPVGSWLTIQGVRYKVTGIEKHTLGGKTMDFCCSEWSEGMQKMKHCADATWANSIIWTTDEATGKFYKASESYQQDGRSCIKMFDLVGNVVGEMCE